ncbi:ABC transporter permease subunit [Mesobacillus foraminis]|uniref:ABC transporter permease n=1 Tax=Mesobacillus foraminis TaxID=279826 RepID=UPI0039A193EF
MIDLIQNELMKIFGKMAGWLFMVVVVLAVLIAGIIYLKVEGPEDPNWRQGIETEISNLESQLEQAPAEEGRWIQDQINELQLYLDQNINPGATSNWHFMNDVVTGVGSIVTLFVVIICSSNVAAEFSDGTIKQLLIRPHKRWSILLSKYAATIIYALMMVAVLVISGYLVGLLLFGSGDFSMRIFEVTLEGRMETQVGPLFFKKIFLYLPGLLMIMTIAFMLSTLFKSQALAVGIGIFVLFFSSTLGGIILMLADKYTWAKYLIFPHLDLTVYALEEQIMEGITMPFSLAVLGTYYVIFISLTFSFFQKRDISI